MREKYERFLQFFSISEWDDAGLALDVFDAVSNDEFPISLAVFFDVLKPSKRQPMRLGIRHLKRHQKRRARIQHRPIQKLKKLQKLFVFFSHYKFVLYTLKYC